jgi:tetratricopeptide (TPR) repeat protein
MSQTFNVGLRIRIAGLQNRPEYNGLSGRIGEIMENGRVKVLLDKNSTNQEVLSVPPQNVQRLPPTPQNDQIQNPMQILSVFLGEADPNTIVDLEEQVLPIAASLESANPVIAHGIFERLAEAHTTLRNFIRSVEIRNKALNAAARIGDRSQLCAAHGNLGTALVDAGNPAAGLEHHRTSLQLAESLADRSLQGSAHGNIGNALQALGDFRAAASAHRTHLRIARENGYAAAEDRALTNLGNALLSAGDAREALGLFRERLTLAEQRGDAAAEGAACGRVGMALQSLDAYGEAIAMHERAIDIARRRGDGAAEGAASCNLGGVRAALGQYGEALRLHRRSAQHPFDHPSVRPPARPCVRPSVRPSVGLSPFSYSARLSVRTPARKCICPSVCLFPPSFINLSVRPFVNPIRPYVLHTYPAATNW